MFRMRYILVDVYFGETGVFFGLKQVFLIVARAELLLYTKNGPVKKNA